MNASPIDNTTPNVVAPNPSDTENVEQVPTRPQRIRLPPSMFTYDTFRNPTFRPAAVSYIQTCPIFDQLPQSIPYIPPALLFIPSPPRLQPYPVLHYYSPIASVMPQGIICQHHLYQCINFQTGCSNDLISSIAYCLRILDILLYHITMPL